MAVTRAFDLRNLTRNWVLDELDLRRAVPVLALDVVSGIDRDGKRQLFEVRVICGQTRASAGLQEVCVHPARPVFWLLERPAGH
ncbi:hypothetical protein MF271_16565 [Deinococcus sp. KNUC1210]|uniref:hypothetical protein n=1 Tax=Deinococcus sp. KNUC1210 TaxID=2917691 RepID=UPI001EEFFB9D|nr:hypothetical protein [Deinococcus sp. KNUC1210]ULH15504.1 hypothetical protein MF271_16565 [Deinococcus sp. KNUC1210]